MLDTIPFLSVYSFKAMKKISIQNSISSKHNMQHTNNTLYMTE